MKCLLLTAFLVLSSNSYSAQKKLGYQHSPSPEGDTHMGADAASTGTDTHDTDVQAQEERRLPLTNEKRPEKSSDEGFHNLDIRTN